MPIILPPASLEFTEEQRLIRPWWKMQCGEKFIHGSTVAEFLATFPEGRKEGEEVDKHQNKFPPLSPGMAPENRGVYFIHGYSPMGEINATFEFSEFQHWRLGASVNSSEAGG